MNKLEVAEKKWNEDGMCAKCPQSQLCRDIDLTSVCKYTHNLGFKHGSHWQQANGWNTIERDKDGFATNECLDKIFETLPIVVYNKRLNEYSTIIDEELIYDWLCDIKEDTDFVFWMKVPELPKNK